MLPYDEIMKIGDRSWSLALVERLKSDECSDDEVNALIKSLRIVSDPRTWIPLYDLLLNQKLPARLRKAASAILARADWSPDPPDDEVLHWWHSGDDITRKHALQCMGLIGRDIVLEVAANPAHELHGAALLRMQFFYDRPEYEELKLAALTHPSAEIRERAAYILLWDEPIRAEDSLINLTHDSVPRVAAEACNTLKYYRTQKVIRHIANLRESSVPEIAQAAEESFAELRNEVGIPLIDRGPKVSRYIRQWLQPIWELLQYDDEELIPEDLNESASASTATLRDVKKAISLPELTSLLVDVDQSTTVLEDTLRVVDWPRYDSLERSILRELMVVHNDQIVRSYAADAFRQWDDAASLIRLLDDPDFTIRKAAMYELSRVTVNPNIAEVAWEHLQRKTTLGVHATETLTTFVRHTDREQALSKLVEIADDPQELEGLRCGALHDLRQFGARHEIEHLSRRLTDPPYITWAFHVSLLDCITDLSVPIPGIGWLRDVDHLDIQDAIARFEAA